jgi:protein TonB
VKKHRYKVSFSITTLIYVSLFLTYLVFVGHEFVVSQKEKDKTINLSLSQFVPEVIEQPIEEEIELPVEEEPEAEIIEPEPEPEIIEPESEPETIPEPVVEKKFVEVVPVVKKVEKKPKPKKIKKKIVKKKRKKKKLVKKRVKKKSSKASRASSRRATSSRIDPNKKSHFLASLRAKINRKKSYPRIAQKRGMQGTVKVRFVILKNGRVGNITVSGPKVFHNSAKGAVKKAFPINVKNAPLKLPTTVNLSLRYKLR